MTENSPTSAGFKVTVLAGIVAEKSSSCWDGSNFERRSLIGGGLDGKSASKRPPLDTKLFFAFYSHLSYSFWIALLRKLWQKKDRPVSPVSPPFPFHLLWILSLSSSLCRNHGLHQSKEAGECSSRSLVVAEGHTSAVAGDSEVEVIAAIDTLNAMYARWRQWAHNMRNSVDSLDSADMHCKTGAEPVNTAFVHMESNRRRRDDEDDEHMVILGKDSIEFYFRRVFLPTLQGLV